MTRREVAPARTGQAVMGCQGLDVGYGDLKAVRGIDMEICAGEVVAVVGSNGVGKTTTLLTLVGELPPLGGRVLWEGEPVSAPLHVRARRGLAFIPEEKSVIMSMSVRDNLKVGGASEELAMALFPELERLLGRRAGLLSGGEQQMLSLARALGRRPKSVVVDELSLGLAPIVADRLVRSLRAAAAEGIAVLVVEQNLSRALALADRFYLMRRGRVDLAAASASYRDRPAELAEMLVAV